MVVSTASMDTYFERLLAASRKPDFNQFLRVLERKAPDRPTLF